jgi:hypothetical protein
MPYKNVEDKIKNQKELMRKRQGYYNKENTELRILREKRKQERIDSLMQKDHPIIHYTLSLSLQLDSKKPILYVNSVGCLFNDENFNNAIIYATGRNTIIILHDDSGILLKKILKDFDKHLDNVRIINETTGEIYYKGANHKTPSSQGYWIK